MVKDNKIYPVTKVFLEAALRWNKPLLSVFCIARWLLCSAGWTWEQLCNAKQSWEGLFHFNVCLGVKSVWHSDDHGSTELDNLCIAAVEVSTMLYQSACRPGARCKRENGEETVPQKSGSKINQSSRKLTALTAESEICLWNTAWDSTKFK